MKKIIKIILFVVFVLVLMGFSLEVGYYLGELDQFEKTEDICVEAFNDVWDNAYESCLKSYSEPICDDILMS